MGSCFVVQAGLEVLICLLSTWIFLQSKQASSSWQCSRELNPIGEGSSGKYTGSSVDGASSVSSNWLSDFRDFIRSRHPGPGLAAHIKLTCSHVYLPEACCLLPLDVPGCHPPKALPIQLEQCLHYKEASPNKLQRLVPTNQREEHSLGNRWFLELWEYLVPHRVGTLEERLKSFSSFTLPMLPDVRKQRKVPSTRKPL